MVDRVLEYMERDHGTGPLNIHIGSDGDPFASLVYRNFMRRVPRLEHVTYTMQTNGLLIRQMYPRVRHIFDRMKTLNISIDGATRQTYESLRRGGSWHKIRENLDFVTELKHKHGFRLHLHMVVQNANWREMPTMLALAREHDTDTVYFNPVQDWNTSDRFPEMAVPESDPQFRAVLEQIKRDPIANAW
jgi:sulfatase maturation enzyme AslB (radical SAM superfamily)